jgi:hypothetical protein
MAQATLDRITGTFELTLSGLVKGYILTVKTEGKSPHTIDFYDRKSRVGFVSLHPPQKGMDGFCLFRAAPPPYKATCEIIEQGDNPFYYPTK